MTKGKYERAPEQKVQKTGAPGLKARKPELPKPKTQTAGAPKPQVQKAEAPKPKAWKPENPKARNAEAPKPQVTQADAPKPKAWKPENPNPKTQTAEVSELTDPEAETPEPKKRMFSPLSLLKQIVVGLIVLAAVAMVIFTVISLTMFNRSERSLFGYRAFIVLSDSMSATDFNAGDVVVVKSVDPATLAPGDIIAFTSQNTSNFGETVTHKIRALTTDDRGNPAFITYGTTTQTDDETPVPYSHVLGKYQFSLPKVGVFFQYLRTGPGYILFVFLPFALLIGYQALQSVHLFRQDKKEEMDKLQAEREQIAAEREETRQMLAEVKKLQAELLREREKKT